MDHYYKKTMRPIKPRERFKTIGLGNVTVPFGGKTTQEDFHPAIDIANKIGTPISATADGVVSKVDNGHVQGENNYGNTVEIKDRNGNVHQFHHLHKIGVRPGQQVQKGQSVATLGNTGATYSKSGLGDGANLDYRIVDAYSKYIDPTPYIRDL